MSEEAAKRIADGAAKAAMQLHAPSIRQIFEYHLDSDSWWQVPSTRQWRLTRAFDWRHAPSIEIASRRLVEHAMTKLIPARFKNTEENLTASLPAWSARNLYVGVDEYARPQPARCRHGRSMVGCLRGIGVQRDQYGNEIPPINRSQPERTNYPPVWDAPLKLSPHACTDCVLLLDDQMDQEPTLPPEPDYYKIARLSNSTSSSGLEALGDLGERGHPSADLVPRPSE